MILSQENYHSPEMKAKYMSASRYKNFCGSLGLTACEAKAVAMEKGEWIEESTPAMIMSSYVDAHFSGTLDVFKAQNPDIFKKDGGLKAAFLKAEEIVQRIESDDYFMKYMSGERQVIMTAELFGVEWSIMIDSFIRDIAIVDLKCMASLRKGHWVRDVGYVSFIELYGYDHQAAIYQAVVEKNTGKKLPFFIAGASKEDAPDIEIIGIDQSEIDLALGEIASNMPRIIQLRNGEAEPDDCGMCGHCRKIKVLSEPIKSRDLIKWRM